jgi:hypothetical protein
MAAEHTEALWYVEQLRPYDTSDGGGLHDGTRSWPIQYVNMLEVQDDGFTHFSACIPLDILLEGGRESITPSSPNGWVETYDIFAALRSRLSLHYDEENPWQSDFREFHYEFRGIRMSLHKLEPTVGEAMFLVALAHASYDKPVETVLREIRECARLGIKQQVDVEQVSDRQKFLETITANEAPPSVIEHIFNSAVGRRFVLAFADYKAAMEQIKTAADKQAAIKRIVDLEKEVLALRTEANAMMRLGFSKGSNPAVWPEENPSLYTIELALRKRSSEDSWRYYDPYDLYEKVDDPKRLSRQEHEQLQLVIMPTRQSRRSSNRW